MSKILSDDMMPSVENAAADDGCERDCGAENTENADEKANSAVKEESKRAESVASSAKSGSAADGAETKTDAGAKIPDSAEFMRDFLQAYVNSEAENRRLKAQLDDAKKAVSAEEMLKRPEVAAFAAENPDVEKMVIEKYLKNVAKGGVPVILGAAGMSPESAVFAPKTLKEAKVLAEKFFRS